MLDPVDKNSYKKKVRLKIIKGFQTTDYRVKYDKYRTQFMQVQYQIQNESNQKAYYNGKVVQNFKLKRYRILMIRINNFEQSF